MVTHTWVDAPAGVPVIIFDGLDVHECLTAGPHPDGFHTFCTGCNLMRHWEHNGTTSTPDGRTITCRPFDGEALQAAANTRETAIEAASLAIKAAHERLSKLEDSIRNGTTPAATATALYDTLDHALLV